MAEAQDQDRKDALDMLTGAWQVSLMVGLILLAFGLIIAFHPSTSFNVICVLVGIAVLLAGVFRLIRSLDSAEQHRAMTAVAGVVLIVIGLILIRHLHLSRVLVAFFVGIGFIIQGTVDLLVGATRGPDGRRHWWPVVFGLVSIAAGIVVIAVPENSITFLAALLGIWIAVIGGLLVVEGFVIRHEVHRAAAS